MPESQERALSGLFQFISFAIFGEVIWQGVSKWLCQRIDPIDPHVRHNTNTDSNRQQHLDELVVPRKEGPNSGQFLFRSFVLRRVANAAR